MVRKWTLKYTALKSRKLKIYTYKCKIMYASFFLFQVTLEGEARYRNTSGLFATELFKEVSEVSKDSKVFKRTVRPNTRYTVKVCTVNRAGCGHGSDSNDKTICFSPPSGTNVTCPFIQQFIVLECHVPTNFLHRVALFYSNPNVGLVLFISLRAGFGSS